MKLSPALRFLALASVPVGCAGVALTQCSAPAPNPHVVRGDTAKTKTVSADAIEAWNVIYSVLQHPRCLNCHPAGDAPLQGDQSVPHQQDVQRGDDGHGMFAMKCQTCHQEHNAVGEHTPPGGPDWHLPTKKMPLVFEGKSSAELCRQLQDQQRNDHHSMKEILDHIEHAPLVLWAWDPGQGRAPVPISHDDLVKATRTWITNGCGCPER
jgi:hypothetical protein